MDIREVLKKVITKLLNIQPAQDRSVNIVEPLSYGLTVLKNRIWYRGDPSELTQFFKQSAQDDVAKSRFWAAVPSPDSMIRKIHSGLPSMIIDKIVDIVVSDLSAITLENEADQGRWDEIAKDNKFNEELLGDSIKNTLIDGDGVFKLSIDEEITQYPIIEFYSGTEVDYVITRGRLQEIIFIAYYSTDKQTYKLEEHYGKGYINYRLLDSQGNEVPLSMLPETAGLSNVVFSGDFIMAVPMKFKRSAKFQNRGESIFEKKSDVFDALDEVISQWIDAIRAGRVKNYIPEDLIPKDPKTGALMRPNPFDNQFIKIATSMKENADDKIDQVQAQINYEAFVESYAGILDLCLQGILSPATLGIDLKKRDNAEAQREKEKTTLYTRDKIIDVLYEVIPQLVDITLKVQDVMQGKTPGNYEASVTFGEYASPDFGSIVEVVGKAKSYGIMSLEQAIEELYGDTWTEEEKAREVERIRRGEYVVDMPAANVDGMGGEEKEGINNGEGQQQE